MGSIEPVGIILRDYKGDETIHYGKEQLEVNSTDGGTQKFIRDDLIAEPVEKTVELDFSSGDMVVTPDDGQVFSSVNIPVPNNLVPENIGEGWNIAGIAGMLKGSGGEGTPYVKSVAIMTQNTVSTDSDFAQTIVIEKDSAILTAWAWATRSGGASNYPALSENPMAIDVSELVISDHTNSKYENVSYTHKKTGVSMSARNTFLLELVVAIDGLVVTPAGNGFFNGTVVSDKGMYNMQKKFLGKYTSTMLLKSISFADGITTAPEYICAGQHCLETVDFSNIASIGSYAFSGCTSLESVDISNITSIKSGAFSGCTSLTGELTIPDAITSIPYSSFAGTKFNKVIFPAGLKSINERAFYNCTHPTEFDFSACTAVPSLYNDYALGDAGNGQVLKIPSSLFDSWSTASGWSDWSSQMVAV